MIQILLAHAVEASGAATGSFPPLNPLLVNFTVALVPTALLFDLLGAWRKNAALKTAGWWTLLIAACLTPPTVLFGWLWMSSMADMDHWQMPYHKWLGVAVGGSVIGLALWRGWIQRKRPFPGWPYGVAAAMLLLALLVQGDLGGSMSFERGIVFTSAEHGEPDEHGSATSQPDHAGANNDHGHSHSHE